MAQGSTPGPGGERAGRLRFVQVVDDGRRIVERPVEPAFVEMERAGTHGLFVNLAVIAEAVFDAATAEGGEGAGRAWPRATVVFAVPGLGRMDERTYEGRNAVRLLREIQLRAAGHGERETRDFLDHLDRAA